MTLIENIIYLVELLIAIKQMKKIVNNKYCLLRQIYNNYKIFLELSREIYKFVTANRKIIWQNPVKPILFLFENNLELMITNIVYILECNINLNFLNLLIKTSLLHYVHVQYVILKQIIKTIMPITRKKLFIVNTYILGKKLQVKIRKTLIYYIKRIKKAANINQK